MTASTGSAAASITATVIAAAAIAAPAAAAEQDDNKDNDPQAAVAAPAVIAAPHNEYLLHMKVLRGLFAALDTIICQGGKWVPLLTKFSQKRPGA